MFHCLDQRLSVQFRTEGLFQWIYSMSEQSLVSTERLHRELCYLQLYFLCSLMNSGSRVSAQSF